ncbi:MAG: 30S ribosomal protein S15 [Bdellovibrionota bacterium]|jgi:small subunit ribosomal protein S15
MITKTQKIKVIDSFKTHPEDTGSTNVQVAILTSRIQELTEHLKIHKKDFSTRRGLLKLVGKRRRLLNFMKAKNLNAYSDLIARLGIRK